MYSKHESHFSITDYGILIVLEKFDRFSTFECLSVIKTAKNTQIYCIRTNLIQRKIIFLYFASFNSVQTMASLMKNVWTFASGASAQSPLYN